MEKRDHRHGTTDNLRPTITVKPNRSPFKQAAEFVDQLLTKEALEQPSDTGKPEELALELPPWFDEKKFNQARRFYWDHCFSFASSMFAGLVAVFSIPSILRVLIGSRRSSSVYTAYKRYLSTILHSQAWFEYDLKPNSRSWKSLHAVRTRHLRAGIASKLKGGGVVSQRDVAFTQFGFFGFTVLKPEKFGIRQLQPGDWDAYNHFWKVIGYMIGLEDRYNICRETMEETREVCRLLQERVFRPCLENVPEYFEHMSRVTLDGMWSINPLLETESFLFWTRYLADVPGYIYEENERLAIQRKIKDKLCGQPIDTGVDVTTLMGACAIDDLPKRSKPNLLYLRDFDCLETTPAFKRLSSFARYKLGLVYVLMNLYKTWLGRLYLNLNFLWSLVLMKYCPYLAFFRWGIKNSLVDIFAEDPVDDTKPKTNEEYYNAPKKPWYQEWFGIIW